jgi:hypothetical protein
MKLHTIRHMNATRTTHAHNTTLAHNTTHAKQTDAAETKGNFKEASEMNDFESKKPKLARRIREARAEGDFALADQLCDELNGLATLRCVTQQHRDLSLLYLFITSLFISFSGSIPRIRTRR